MKKLCPEGRIPRTGLRQISDPTDGEYVDKTVARLKRDYLACPKEWRETFLSGLTKKDFDALMDLL